MLNLTANPITLIAESGETTTIEPSGYVARVETMRREDDFYGFPLMSENDVVFIIEETPTKIVISAPGLDTRADGEMLESLIHENLVIVTRDVAEAAAHGLRHWCSPECKLWSGESCSYHGALEKHPLAARMVWADDIDFLPMVDNVYAGSGYRSLRRVQGGVK